jgi:hypothetical protein
LIDRLRDEIQQSGHLVAKVTSKDCQTLKSTIKLLIEQLMRLELELADDDYEQVCLSLIQENAPYDCLYRLYKKLWNQNLASRYIPFL